MNKGFISLWKVSLKQTFDFRGKRNLSLFIPILLILIFGSLFCGLYSFVFCMLAKEADISMSYVIYTMGGFASLIALATSITKVKITLFGGNDYDMLASLPIKKRDIIFIKFFSLYLMELLYSFIFVAPATLLACIFGKTPLFLIDGILILMVTPVLPLLLAGIIGMLIGLIADRFRFGNLLTILFLIGFLGMIAYISYAFNNQSMETTQMVQMFEIFIWANPTQALLKLDFIGLNYLLYVGVNLLILFLILLIFAMFYDYFHVLLNSFKSHRAYVAKSHKAKGGFKALFLLEGKRYFSSKAYLMNTMTGGILSVLMTIVLLLSFTSVPDPGVGEVLNQNSPYFCLFVLWCSGFAVPSAVSINYEGKSFWLVKSLPIDYKKYAFSKVLLSYVVLAPFVLIASIILLFFGRMEFMPIFTTLVLPQLYLMAMCFIGIIVNSKVYRLDWSTEMEAVKNARSVVIVMLLDVGFTLLLGGVFISVSLWNFIAGATLALLFVIVVLIFLIINFQKKIANNLTGIEI